MSLKAPRVVIAEATAMQVLTDMKIDGLPVDPSAIASSKDIVVKAKPSENDGFSGMLVRVGQNYGILYSTFIDSKGFQNFSIAHELGHYFLPGHMEQVLKDGPHHSRAGFGSSDPFELEADLFAAALLMPEGLVRPLLRRSDDGLALVRSVADQCRVSLTAAGIRYAKLSSSAVAVILSTEGIVNFSIFSESMKDAKVRWLRPGLSIPTPSVTADFIIDKSNILKARTAMDTVNLADWFDCPVAHLVTEEVIGLGTYGKVLTVIHSSRLTAAAEGMEDVDAEEDELRESWIPKFRK